METWSKSDLRKTTLLDLIQTVQAYVETDTEVVWIVAQLVNTRKVVLCGNFAGETITFS